MSDLSDRKSASTMSLGATELGAQAQSKVKPVQVWAAVGGAVLAFQMYVWIRWITGPFFERVARRTERTAHL